MMQGGNLFKLLFEKVLTSTERLFIISISKQLFLLKMVAEMKDMHKQDRKNKTKKNHRYRVVKPFRFFIFVLICITSLVLTAYAVFGSGHAAAETHTRYTEVKVQDNDTLWTLIETYNSGSDIDVRKALYDVYEINNLKAADIKAGDTIVIPIY